MKLSSKAGCHFNNTGMKQNKTNLGFKGFRSGWSSILSMHAVPHQTEVKVSKQNGDNQECTDNEALKQNRNESFQQKDALRSS